MSFKKIKKEETTPLLSYATVPPSNPPYSSTSAIGIEPAHSSTKQLEESKGGSIPIVVFTVFLQSIGFTITMPSMAYYVEQIGVSSTFYGWIVAIYSVGQFLASPIFGYWSNHAPARLVIVVSLFISAIGNILYGFVGNLPAAGWLMLLSRFLVGVGAGNVAVCRAYASEASSLSNRAGTMAKMSMAQGMGFVVGPIIGTILTFFNFKMGPIPFDQYTSPGFVSAILGIGNTIFAGLYFVELNSRGQKVDATKKEDIEKPTKSELISIFVSIFLFFVVIAVFSVFETMITIVTKHDFGWNAKDNGYLFISVGVLSVIVFAIISTPAMKKKDDRMMMFIGTILQIIGLAVAVTWVWPVKFQTRLTEPQFFAAAVLIGIGYPIASAYMFAIYSKVLNPRFQGTKMGWLTSGGSLARMLGPVWATHAFHFGGGELLFLGTDSLVIISLFVLIIFYKRLAPHPSYFATQAKNDLLKNEINYTNEKPISPVLSMNAEEEGEYQQYISK